MGRGWGWGGGQARILRAVGGWEEADRLEVESTGAGDGFDVEGEGKE